MAIVMTMLSGLISDLAKPTAVGEFRVGGNGSPYGAAEYDTGSLDNLTNGLTEWDNDLSDGFNPDPAGTLFDFNSSGSLLNLVGTDSGVLTSSDPSSSEPIAAVDLRACVQGSLAEAVWSGLTVTFRKKGVTQEIVNVGTLDAAGTDADSTSEDLAVVLPASSDNDEVIISGSMRLRNTRLGYLPAPNELFCQAAIYTSGDNPSPIVALPPYVVPSNGSSLTYDRSSRVLNLTGGRLDFVSDAANDLSDLPMTLNVIGSAASVIFQTSQHLRGMSLSDGATATVSSVTDRSHSNHDVLVIGSSNQAQPPLFSIDSHSKLDLMDNDLVIHEASLSAVMDAYTSGRDSGRWDGNGISSSVASSTDSVLAEEEHVVGYAFNGSLSSWGVGSFSEPLSSDGNDLIFKYTYMGDFTLDGKVTISDSNILSGNWHLSLDSDWYQGDANGDGLVNITDFNLMSAFYNYGTIGSGIIRL